ncbi:hypothetical protein [Streptomyces sp. VRA16 Mangrove soil]|uniref:hypothetical protein n=1 Tax=Streptomyces sp. VRA16 Mangrove soil TaxID=2817434 RepID=UPI001A9F1CC4|nr:hypothetical protein [Streptomyces sp. VRA16 Mangrove soil]MBO1333677.1 hypothetical protein [Streptomyces sp. VRA16 Mangrove soil]
MSLGDLEPVEACAFLAGGACRVDVPVVDGAAAGQVQLRTFSGSGPSTPRAASQ